MLQTKTAFDLKNLDVHGSCLPLLAAANAFSSANDVRG
jgi:hypothetical protein